VLELDKEIEPYDKSIYEMSLLEKNEWTDIVINQLSNNYERNDSMQVGHSPRDYGFSGLEHIRKPLIEFIYEHLSRRNKSSWWYRYIAQSIHQINAVAAAAAFLETGNPVISVDFSIKELGKITPYRLASHYRTSYPSTWVTKQVVSEDFQRFLPKLKRLRVFGNIIESMRTDAFLYKTA
jgi:hypothetical protein